MKVILPCEKKKFKLRVLNNFVCHYSFVCKNYRKFAAERWGEAEGVARRGRGCSVAPRNIGHNDHKKLSGFMYMIRKSQSNTEVWVLRIRDFGMNLEISNCFL